MQNDLDQPFWKKEIGLYQGLEIHPLQEICEGGEMFCERCEPEEAHIWSVYGVPAQEGGTMCFEDFQTQEDAIAFTQKLYKIYPHLKR